VQSINQSINKSNHQSINQSINQINQSTNQSIKSINQSINQSITSTHEANMLTKQHNTCSFFHALVQTNPGFGFVVKQFITEDLRAAL